MIKISTAILCVTYKFSSSRSKLTIELATEKQNLKNAVTFFLIAF